MQSRQLTVPKLRRCCALRVDVVFAVKEVWPLLSYSAGDRNSSAIELAKIRHEDSICAFFDGPGVRRLIVYLDVQGRTAGHTLKCNYKAINQQDTHSCECVTARVSLQGVPGCSTGGPSTRNTVPFVPLPMAFSDTKLSPTPILIARLKSDDRHGESTAEY